jgi:hypothetical protein
MALTDWADTLAAGLHPERWLTSPPAGLTMTRASRRQRRTFAFFAPKKGAFMPNRARTRRAKEEVIAAVNARKGRLYLGEGFARERL